MPPRPTQDMQELPTSCAGSRLSQVEGLPRPQRACRLGRRLFNPWRASAYVMKHPDRADWESLQLTRLTSFADNLSSKITLVDRILQLVAHQLVVRPLSVPIFERGAETCQGIYPTAVSVVIFNEKSIFGSSDEPPNLVRKRDRDAKSQITRAPSGVIEVV